MKQIIKNIYDNEICMSKWMQKDMREVEEAFENRLKQSKNSYSEGEREEIRDMVYSALETAKQKAFQRGIQYTVQFLAEAMGKD